MTIHQDNKTNFIKKQHYKKLQPCPMQMAANASSLSRCPGKPDKQPQQYPPQRSFLTVLFPYLQIEYFGQNRVQ